MKRGGCRFGDGQNQGLSMAKNGGGGGGTVPVVSESVPTLQEAVPPPPLLPWGQGEGRGSLL